MQKLRNVVIPVTLVLGGCTGVPNLPPQDTVSVSDIVENVICEFQAAGDAAPFLKAGYGWTAGAEIQMQVINGMETVLDSSYSLPVSSVFFPSLSSRLASSADATRSVGLSVNYADKDRRACDAPVSRKSKMRLQGELGLEQWANTMQASVTKTKIEPNKASFTVEFTLERSGSVTPAFGNLAQATHIWRISPKVALSGKNVHRLIVAFTKNAPPAKPLLVTTVDATGKKSTIQSTQPSENNEIRNDNYLFSITPQRNID
ncbi:hypothetical protein [Rhizobium sp. PP-CC-3G-465]|uniref:hypothetical protein n=1 Tax=Rhizobium sp. PP-CC-3G-465 TaxID=2135648 RepID=UPI00104CED17|nr:hypothetical protein C8J33_11227 [Rhizobium sp. PP-CC-3G-465]